MGEGKRLLVATVLTAWVICTQAQQLQPLAIASSAGGNASLPCSANYTNPYSLRWLRLRDTNPTAIMGKSKDVISTDMPEKYKLERSMTLRILNLNESDVGKYYCTYTAKNLSTITDEPITLFITDVPMSGCETGSDKGGCDCVVDGDAAENVTFTAKGFPQKPYVSLTDEEGNPLRVHEGIALHVQPDDITAPSWAFNPSHLLEGRNGTLFLGVSNDIYFPSGSTLSLLETKTICTSRSEVPAPANGPIMIELWTVLVITIVVVVMSVLMVVFLCMWKRASGTNLTPLRAVVLPVITILAVVLLGLLWYMRKKPDYGTFLAALCTFLVILILICVVGFWIEFCCCWRKRSGRARVSLTQVIPSHCRPDITPNEEAQTPTGSNTEGKGKTETAYNEFEKISVVSFKMDVDQSDGTSKHINNETVFDDQERRLPLAGKILLEDIRSASDERKSKIKACVLDIVDDPELEELSPSTADGNFIGETSFTGSKSDDTDLSFVCWIMENLDDIQTPRDRAKLELMITTHLWLDQSEISLSKRSSEMSNSGPKINASNNRGAGHLASQIIKAMEDEEGMEKYRRLIPSIILRAFNEAQCVDLSCDKLSRSFRTENISWDEEGLDQRSRLAVLWVRMMDKKIAKKVMKCLLNPKDNQVQPGSNSQPSQPSNDSAEPLLQASN